MQRILRERLRREEAEMAFQKAISTSPSYHASLFNIGKLCAESEQFDDPVFLLENAKKGNKSHFGILLSLGQPYHQSGEVIKSYSILKNAEKSKPRNRDPKVIISILQEGK